MTKDEALKLAAEMERGQFSTTLLPAAAELRRLHEENRKLKAQEALDRKAENARELGLDYEPEQEPLEYWNAVEGWVKIDEVREHFDSVGCGTIYKTAGEGREPLYTTPPQRKPLTDEEIGAILEDINAFGTRLYTFARAIEAAHGIKGEA